MKWYIALLLFCFSFSTIAPFAEGGGRSKSRSASVKKKRSASASAKKKRSTAASKKKKRSAAATAKKKRSASASAKRQASAPKPRPRSTPARKVGRTASVKPKSKSQSPSPPKRASSFVSEDKITSQKVRGNQGKYTPVGDAQKVKYTGNKTLGVKQKTFYRGVKDVKNLPKGGEKTYVDHAFKNGIPSNSRIKQDVPGVHDSSKPAVTNVWQHQNKSAENSAFVATTSSKKVAAQKYSGPSGGYFEIKPKSSKVIDVNKTVGKSTDKAKLKDKEYLFPNEVPSHEIKAWHQVDTKGKVMKTTNNPNYGN